MAKHCQLNFAKDTGYKLVLVKQLRDSVSVNLWAGCGSKLREYSGSLLWDFLSPWHQLLATVGDKILDYSYLQCHPIQTAIYSSTQHTEK